MVMALVDAANDRDKSVIEMVRSSLFAIGLEKPELVLRLCKDYILKHQKVQCMQGCMITYRKISACIYSLKIIKQPSTHSQALPLKNTLNCTCSCYLPHCTCIARGYVRFLPEDLWLMNFFPESCSFLFRCIFVVFCYFCMKLD